MMLSMIRILMDYLRWMSMSKFFKKGQMEVLGIALVVVIILFGIMIALRLSSSFQPTENLDAKELFELQEMTDNFLSSVLSSQTTCLNQDISDLILDCATTRISRCGGVDSCEYLNTTFTHILNETFNSIEKSYAFRIAQDPENPLLYLSYQCDFARSVEGESDSYLLPVIRSTPVEIRLKVCY